MCIRRLIVHPACNHTDDTHFIPCLLLLPTYPPNAALPPGAAATEPQSCPSLTSGPYEWNPLSKCPSCIRLEAQYRAELLLPGSRANDMLVGGDRIYAYPTERGAADRVHVYQVDQNMGAGPQAQPDPARIDEFDVGNGGDREGAEGEPWKAMIFRWADGRELKILVVEEGGQGGWAWERTGRDGEKVWGGESW